MFKYKDTLLQLTLNIVPLLGVIFFDWSVFALIYSYWLETLGITLITSIKILTARQSDKKPPHVLKALLYLVLNTGLLVFYLLFIFVFIGVMISNKQPAAVPFSQYLLLVEPSFRYSMLSLLGIKLVEFVVVYFYGKAYETTSPKDFIAFLNPRTIIIHLVIVLGVFAYQYTSQATNNRIGVIAFAAAFVVIKSLVDAISYYFATIKRQTPTEPPT